MKTKNVWCRKQNLKAALACVAALSIGWTAMISCQAQTAAVNLSPDLQDVVKLSQAQMEDDVIIGEIKNSGKTYKLSVNDLIYLKSQGVSQPVIKALQLTQPTAPAATATAALPAAATRPAPAAVAPVSAAATPAVAVNAASESLGAEPPALAETESDAPAAQPADAAFSTPPPAAAPNNESAMLSKFQTELTPYGEWIQTPEGPAWKPSVPPGWRPYYDGGHWINTDQGWYWQSDYVWGDIPFHYGRWAYSPAGWLWTPGYQFAPAWVCWRHAESEGFCGWAPLPPGAVMVESGWMFHGAHVGVDFDFGLTPGFFTFVAFDHFWEPNYRLWIVRHERVVFLYHHSVFYNHYRIEHGRFIHEGIDRHVIARVTHHEIREENIREIRAHEIRAHVEERAHDRVVLKSGGHIEAARHVEVAHAEHGRMASTEHGHENGKTTATHTSTETRSSAGGERSTSHETTSTSGHGGAQSHTTTTTTTTTTHTAPPAKGHNDNNKKKN